MQHGEFAQLIDNYRTSGTVITTTTPVKLVLPDGDIVDVKEVKWSGIDGGQIQIFAEGFEDDEFPEENKPLLGVATGPETDVEGNVVSNDDLDDEEDNADYLATKDPSDK